MISGGAGVTFTNLTIVNASAQGGADGAPGAAGQPGANGGAIFNQGTLTLTNAAITNSHAGGGGSGGAGASAGGGTGGAGGSGGAVYNTGALTLNGATISSDTAGNGGTGGLGASADAGFGGGGGGAGGTGGGIENAGGTLTVTGSTIRGNTAGNGGLGGNGGQGMKTTGGGGKRRRRSERRRHLVRRRLAHGHELDLRLELGRRRRDRRQRRPRNHHRRQWRRRRQRRQCRRGRRLQPVERFDTPGHRGREQRGGRRHRRNRRDRLALRECWSRRPRRWRRRGLRAGDGDRAEQLAGRAERRRQLLGTGPGRRLQPVLRRHELPVDVLECRPGPRAAAGQRWPGGDDLPPAGECGDRPDPRGGRELPGDRRARRAATERLQQLEVRHRGLRGRAAGRRPTRPATNIGLNAGTVAASVTPYAGLGHAAVVFQYGTTTKYGKATGVQRLGGITATPVTAKLSGLKPNTLYHYRVVVVAMDGTATGKDATFTTSVTPAITGLSIKPKSFSAARGATVSYKDSRVAMSTLEALRCAQMKPGRCVRFVKFASFTRQDAAGLNKVTIKRRFGALGLQPGRYQLQLTPRSNGKAGKMVTATFSVT